MKAHISNLGCLVITAENETEEYALRQWKTKASIEYNSPFDFEKFSIKGSYIDIKVQE